MAYADLTFYKGTYQGSAIPDAVFPYWATQASDRINALTFGRATSSLEEPNLTQLKMATCAVADVLYKLDTAGGIVESEKVGSFSRTMKVPANDSEDKRVRAAATLYLGRTGLMYRGVDDVL